MENKTTVLKGLAPRLHEGAWERAEEMVKENPNLCIVPEIESGFPLVVTLEQRQQMIDAWEACKPKGDWKAKGKIVYFGTGGGLDMDNNLFYDT